MKPYMKFEKTCTNCVHRRWTEYGDAYCVQSYHYYYIPTLGRQEDYLYCRDSRDRDRFCGPDGVWFKPKLSCRIKKLLGVKL